MASLATLCFLGAAEAAEVTYQYYRYTPVTTVENGTNVQLSEFTMSRGGVKLNLNGSTGMGPALTVTVTGGGGDPSAAEGATKLLDGTPGTKWFSNSLASVTFAFTAPVTIDSYNVATANDFLGRTPSAWLLEGSVDSNSWTTLDIRTGQTAPRYKGLFTYQAGYPITPAGSPTVTNIYATTAAIVTPATPVTIAYTTANTTSAVINPGNFPATTTGATFTPAASGTYTVLASNATSSGTGTFPIKVLPGAGDVLNYRYVRFTPTKLRDNTVTLIQLTEFEFYNGATKVPVASVTNPGGNNPGAEGPAKAIDGNLLTTKWLDFNRKGLVFDFGSTQTFDSYQFYTGGDAPERDPVRWTMEASTDGTVWTLVESVTDYDYPTTRIRANTPAGTTTPSGKLPFYYRVPAAPTFLTWTGALGSEWDKTTANFSGAQTVFADGLNAKFDDSSGNKTVNATVELAPGIVNFAHTSGTYTMGGAIVAGSGSIQKTGAGEVVFTTPQNLRGGITLGGGKFTSAIHRGLGDADAPGTTTLATGATLDVTATQYTQRPFASTGGTINVAGTSSLVNVGPISLAGTMTKTGPGTLTFYGYNGSATTTDQKMVISEGVVEFGTDCFNQTIFGGNKLNAVIQPNAILRGTAPSALGGDQLNYQTGINQLRMEGGTVEFTGGRNYFPVGFVNVGGVDQGRYLLKGGYLTSNGQMESAKNDDADATNAKRSIISTEASADSSQVFGTGSLTANTSYWVFDVPQGPAQEDLLMSILIDGGYGFIKEGAGNLVLTRANTYAGGTGAETWKMPDGTTIHAGTLTVVNGSGSATGPSSVLLSPGTTLAGTGFITGIVKANGNIEPGDVGFDLPIGTLSLGATTLAGSYNGEIDDLDPNLTGFINDQIAVTGNLNITGATCHFTNIGEASAPSYVIATYTGTLTGTFGPSSTVPAGYVLDYATPGQILLVSTGTPVTGYDAFTANPANNLTDGVNDGPTQDPDGDGISNLLEFVFGGLPNGTGASNTSILPTQTQTATTLVVTFKRSDASEGDSTLKVQWSADLVNWGPPNEVVVGPASAGIVAVTEDTPSADFDTVTVTIPKTGNEVGQKLFARVIAAH